MLIRRAIDTDEDAVSRICLLTAFAGKSAEELHDFGELPGLCYAVPYLKLPTTWAFVLVDDEKEDRVVGYVVGSNNTREYEKYTAEHWWPPLREKYPVSRMSKSEDERYAKYLQAVPPAADANIEFSPVHVHINILPEYQRQGWGRRMIGTAVKHVEESAGIHKLWLGIDLRNEGALQFYLRLGFRQIPGSPEGNLGLEFAEFK